MVVSVDSSLLLSWAQLKSGLTGASAGGLAGVKTAKAPTPPWQTPSATPAAKPGAAGSTAAGSGVPHLSAQARAALNGGHFFDIKAAKLDVQGASETANHDYQGLFAVYQGLDVLNQLAQQMGSKALSSTEKAQIQRRFADGMKELQGFLAQTSFNGFKLAQGKVQESGQTTVGAEHETDSYVTKALYTGPMNGAVPAFQGAVQFSMTVDKPSGAPVVIDFDFAEMGATPRSMGNVVQYLNDKLQTAGVATRFASVFTPGAPRTATVGGKTVDLGNAPDEMALKLKGVSTETISFSAPVSSPAVYLAQTSGNAVAKTPDDVRQLYKLQTDPVLGDTAVGDRISASTLGPEVKAVRATASAPDGSLYVLADVGAAIDGQPIKGQGDVALQKYDSAGNLVYTRTLGAGDTASGYALAVSADGSRVAVAGAASGVLQGTVAPLDATVANTFVTVFDDAGEEQWTQRRGALQGDQPSGVAFGADGSVYVTGKAFSAMLGAAGLGGSDGYLEGFTAAGAANFTVQFGGAGQDLASGLAVDGSSVYVAGVENGHGVIRQYDLQPAGAPTLSGVRDLGDLQGGNIAGVAVDGSGAVIVAGSTRNGLLDAGNIGTIYGPGKNAFVAALQPGLAGSPSDAISFFQDGGDTTVSGLSVTAGKVYVAGQAAHPPTANSGGLDSQVGFAMQIDPASGAVGWLSRIPGADDLSSPTSIAVDATGASVLDQLGLPQGQIDYASSKLLTSISSLRAGDEFSIRSGSSSHGNKVVIAADDTLQSLATKILRASSFSLTATVLPLNGTDQLKLAPINPRTQVQLVSGPAGQDVLGALGLAEGVLNKPQTSSAAKPKPNFSLLLSSTLNLQDDADVKAAQKALASSMNTLKSAYTLLSSPPKPKTGAGGKVPAYLTAQIANYQAALNRLTGGA
jgi:hypothetical protein